MGELLCIMLVKRFVFYGKLRCILSVKYVVISGKLLCILGVKYFIFCEWNELYSVGKCVVIWRKICCILWKEFSYSVNVLVNSVCEVCVFMWGNALYSVGRCVAVCEKICYCGLNVLHSVERCFVFIIFQGIRPHWEMG